jgi:hypothetical protein
MANNTPITARISKGLFGKSSSKVTEPLLNVGPAGVSGNNQTKDVPSPSKMKSAFKMMASPFKQVKVPSATSKTGTSGTETITNTYTADYLKPAEKVYVGNPTAAWRAKHNTPEKRSQYNKGKQAELAKDPAYNPTLVKGAMTTTTETSPGSLESDQLYTRDKGDAQTALDRRDVIRSGKVAARQTKRAEINVGKASAEISGLKGKEKRKEAKTVKNKAKLNQATTNLAVAQGQSEGAKNQSAQNIKGTSTKNVLGAGRELSKADMSTDEQETLNKKNREQEKLSRTTKKTVVNVPAGELAGTKPVGVEVEEVKTAAEKKDNGFFAKKSPMKLKYFK